jgi:hypothetical protein
MEKLIATYKLELPFYLLINRSQDELVNYRSKISDFDVVITLINNYSGAVKYENDEEFRFAISELEISVGRNETVAPPPVKITDQGGRDYSTQTQYFDQRTYLYRLTAIEAINRLISFFKFELHNPFLRHLLPHENLVHDGYHVDPKWTDENGNEVGRSTATFYHQPLPGLDNRQFGVRLLAPAEDVNLQSALETPISVSLIQELLSDAQSAAFEGNFRRAVLELAIACEVVIYQAYFGVSTPASEAFDYLIVEQYVQIPPKDLIHKVAKRAFKESFQDKYPIDYKNIDNLFNCRNKVAHRGQLTYVDNKGTHDVDIHKLSEWWQSVEVLIQWIGGLKK